MDVSKDIIRHAFDGEGNYLGQKKGSPRDLDAAKRKFGWTFSDVAPVIPPNKTDVELERDRRLAHGFVLFGHRFQADETSMVKINGAVSMAMLAQAAGIATDDPEWQKGGPLIWRAADNTDVPMTIAQTFAFGLAAGAFVEEITRASHALKDMDPIPQDFEADTYWGAT